MLTFLDILGYLKKTHKNPKFGRVKQVQLGNLVGNSLVGTCLTLPNLGFLWLFFKYPKISNNGNVLFFPVCTCICIHLFEERQDLTVQCTYVTCLNLARIFSSLANISSFVGSLIGKLSSVSLTVSNNLTHLRENSNQVSMVYNDDSLSKIRQQDIKIYL